jgi:hypothetical protein
MTASDTPCRRHRSDAGQRQVGCHRVVGCIRLLRSVCTHTHAHTRGWTAVVIDVVLEFLRRRRVDGAQVVDAVHLVHRTADQHVMHSVDERSPEVWWYAFVQGLMVRTKPRS